MFTLPIDTSKMGAFQFEECEVVENYETHLPKKNEAGLVQYRFLCRYKAEGAKRKETVEVKVFLDREPNIPPYADISFVNLQALYWSNGDRSGISFTADRIVAAQSKK